VVEAEGIEADRHEVEHQIEHLAEDSGRSAEDITETMRANGTYALLEEETARQNALGFLAENAVAVPMPEEDEEDEEDSSGEQEPEAGEARVEATVETAETTSEGEKE
jgi:trigger factor